MYRTGFVLVLSLAAVQLRENPLHRAWDLPRDTLIAEAVLALVGIIAALASAGHRWTLPLPAEHAASVVRPAAALPAA